MLDTVLEIGKAFRNSATGLKHHRYVKQCPKDNDKQKILRLSLPVKKDFTFDFDKIKIITDENLQEKLYYLTFKTSDADGLVKYIFGDIYHTLVKGKEVGGGYYRLGDKNNKQKAYQNGSFLRGEEDFKDIEDIAEKFSRSKIDEYILKLFRDRFRNSLAHIEKIFRYQVGVTHGFESGEIRKKTFLELLNNEQGIAELTAKKMYAIIKQSRGSNKIFRQLFDVEEIDWNEIENSDENKQKLIGYSTGNLFLHFDFNGKHWYEFEKDLEIINKKILEDFMENANGTEGYILKKYLYKTLSSPEKDLQFPDFSPSGRHRNKLFLNADDVLDLLYAIDYSKTALLKVPYSDIKIVVLPKGKNLKSKHYENFVARTNTLKDEQEQEKIIEELNKPDRPDLLFTRLVENVADEIVQFDLIFSKRGGQTSPDIDLLEISGIEKSCLQEINRRIVTIKKELYDKRKAEISTESKPFSITYSFLNILSENSKDKKKYQSHLYKVLPQIYTGTYYRDPFLLSMLIKTTEMKIREGTSNFIFLKYEFYFLTTIQNTRIEGENLMQIKNSQSYNIGLLLGKLARQFAAWRDDCPIKSFEKSYVGNLSRRITTLSDLIRFKAFIEEKLVIHEKTYPNIKEASLQLAEQVKAFEGRYDKDECAFGFFESYFYYEKQRKEDQTQSTTPNN